MLADAGGWRRRPLKRARASKDGAARERTVDEGVPIRANERREDGRSGAALASGDLRARQRHHRVSGIALLARRELCSSSLAQAVGKNMKRI